jgi:RNA polymerase subunit RPABC4/transcription elongation factor Spt4
MVYLIAFIAYVAVLLFSLATLDALGEAKGVRFSWLGLLCVLFAPWPVLVAWATPPNTAVLEARAIKSGRSKVCPACKELIRSGATTCKHCGTAQIVVVEEEAVVEDEQYQADEIKAKRFVNITIAVVIILILIFFFGLPIPH